jgi:CBS domain-containing protein
MASSVENVGAPVRGQFWVSMATAVSNGVARARYGHGARAAASRSLEVRRELGAALVSVAGLVGRPVRGRDGEQVGTLADVVVRTEAGYPLVAGCVVRIGARRAWVPVEAVAGLEQGQLRLLSSRIDLTDVERRPGEIQLVGDVIDHQVVDVHGVRVVRASDLYLAAPGGQWRLVGVDVSWLTFLRRALPGRTGRRPSPGQVLDWAGVRPFGLAGCVTGGPVQLASSNAALRRLRPGELADLLEDLGRVERRELLDTLDPAVAADALEEMQANDLLSLLRDAPVDRAAQLLASMERDEAADALRDLPEDEREDVLRAMAEAPSDELRTLLGFEEHSAGGVMTSELVRVDVSVTVGEAVAALRAAAALSAQPPGVAVVDGAGRLVDDIAVLELLGVEPDRPIAQLVGPPWPVTVPPGAGLDEVVETMTENRGSSILVVDDADRPIGRILADDVIDALVQDEDREWPWQRRIGPAS